MKDVILQDEIEKFCKMNKVKKKDIASICGITPCQLSHWLKRRIYLPQTAIDKMIAILNSEIEIS